MSRPKADGRWARAYANGKATAIPATEAGRRKKIEAFVAMLARGETVYPQKPKPGR